MNNTILIIGIDGGTWSVLKPAIDAGYMPCLKKLIHAGASGILKSVIPAITPAAWGSFQTGRNPGQTGVYDFWKWNKETHKDTLVNSSDLNNTIWQLATSAGKTVGTLNVPMTYPPKSNSGDIISGILTPNMNSNFTWPPELKHHLLDKIPDYEILNLEKASISPVQTSIEDFIKIMKKDLDWRLQAAEFMLTRKSYDLFMVHYHATDIIQHGLWCYLDETHPLFDSNKQIQIFSEFYGHLDNVIDKTINLRQHDNTTCFIVSDHGFQSHLKEFNIAPWLKEKGLTDNKYLDYRNHNISKSQSKKPMRLADIAKKLGTGKLLRIFLSDKHIEKIELITGLKNKAQTYNFNTTLHCSSSCRECFVTFVNHNDKNETINKLLTMLNSVVDENGNPIIERTYRKEEIYSGDKTNSMPDLTIVPVDKWSIVFKPGNMEQLITELTPENTIHLGTHHSDGIFIAFGNNIKPNTTANQSLMDITPTLFWLLNLNNDNIQFDGKIIRTIWTDDFLTDMNREASIFAKETQSTDNHLEFSGEDRQTLEKRLNDLGYM